MPLWSPSNRLSHFKLAYVAVPMAFKSIGQGHGSLGGKEGLESMILCGERKAYPEIERPWPGVLKLGSLSEVFNNETLSEKN